MTFSLRKITYSGQVDLMNILLMVVSCFLAMHLPFTLFLFSYAVLGPLHYLTEIFWLRKNQYHLSSRNNYLWLVAIVLVIVLFYYLPHLAGKGAHEFEHSRYVINFLILLAFFCAVFITVLFKRNIKIVSFLICIILFFFLWKWPSYLLIAGLFLITIVHVSLFTWIFMITGALKNNSLTGYIAIALYIFCIIFLLAVPIDVTVFSFSEYEKKSFLSAGFARLNHILSNLFSKSGDGSIFFSEKNIRIQTILAFTYTYHYLNWFSKIEIIKWNRVPKKEKITTGVLWALSMLLYMYNYRTGLVALFFLSLLHVILEFPLNIKSITGLGLLLRSRFKGV